MIINLQAQDSSKGPLNISGSVDTYYRYDVNNPKASPYNSYSSFTKSQNSFELGMISIKGEYQIRKVGMVADLGFGKRSEEFSYNDSGSSQVIKQLFINYSVTSKLKLSLGSWATHLGYESVDPYANGNYSMSYLFSYGPFSHTGLKAEYALTDYTSFLLGIVNPVDLKQASNFPKMIIGQITTGSGDGKFKSSLNYLGGKNNDSGKLYQADVVLNYTLSEKLSFGYNGTLQLRQHHQLEKWARPESWWGSALYTNIHPNEWLGFTLRTEYFNDKRNVLGLNTDVFETTFSTNFKIENLILIPEIRFENSGRKIYSKRDGLVNNTGNFLFAAVYKF